MPPKLSERCIQALAQVITGDGGASPRRSGPQLVRFFNAFGANDVYPKDGGFPSRWVFAEDKLRQMNGTMNLVNAVEATVSTAEFANTAHDVVAVVDQLNLLLVHDGLTLRREGRGYRLRDAIGNLVQVEVVGAPADPLTHEFIHEQLQKCSQKLDGRDFDGAITNARALLEAVLREIEVRVQGRASDTKGDLGKQYKEVQGLLRLSPDRQDIDGSLRQMLSGLVSIVNGIAAARNAMSYAHARNYRPATHHARLVVNAAQTLADFLLAACEAQRERGMLGVASDGGGGAS